jgi:hypothetical protein
MTSFFKKLSAEFLDAFKDPAIVTPQKKLRFFEAINRGDVATISNTVQNHPDALTWRTKYGLPLFAAIDADKIHSFRRLLDLGAKLDQPDPEDFMTRTPLIYAVDKYRTVFVRELILRGSQGVESARNEAWFNEKFGLAKDIDKFDKERQQQLAQSAAAQPSASPQPQQQEQSIQVLKPLKVTPRRNRQSVP